MPLLKLTKTVIDRSAPKSKPYELRDTEVRGFLCKISPSGKKVFFLEYRTLSRQRRKPKIGDFGIFTVQEAREIARRWKQEIRGGGDPSRERSDRRNAPTVNELCERFVRDHCELFLKPRTQKGYEQQMRQRVKPAIGQMLVKDVQRADILAVMRDNAYAPTQANRTLSLLKKMFNCAELWGLRDDGTNPCRLVKMYKTNPKTRLLSDSEVKSIFEALDRIEYEQIIRPVYVLVCRLQFAFAARINEILQLEWSWIDFELGLIRWPDSKTGFMEKYMDAETQALIEAAPSRGKSLFVCPAIQDPDKPLSPDTYYKSGWKRILEIAEVAHCGTHHVRHRAATDIANAVDNVRTGMQMTGHKTVQMFMRYVHPEEDRIRAAQAKIAKARGRIIGDEQGPRLSSIPDA